MKIAGYITAFVLFGLSIGINVLNHEECWLGSIEPIITGLAVSLLTGVIVYDLTVDIPQKKNDRKRIRLVRNELSYVLDRINLRLNWLGGLNVDSSSDKYNTKLGTMKYGSELQSKPIRLVYDVLYEIKESVEEFKRFATPIILSVDEKHDLTKKLKEVLQRPRAISEARMFVRQDFEYCEDKTVDIGDELHDLIKKLVALKEHLDEKCD